MRVIDCKINLGANGASYLKEALDHVQTQHSKCLIFVLFGRCSVVFRAGSRIKEVICIILREID